MVCQFRIVQNIVNCALNLKKWENSNVCIYCNKRNIDIEYTLVHALVDWQTIQQWVQYTNVAIDSPSLQNVSRDDFLFG